MSPQILHSRWVSNDGASTLTTGVIEITALLALCSVIPEVSCVLAMLN